MTDDLFTKAKNSIAFNKTNAVDINNKFAEINKKLFGFAYYEPVPIHNTNAHACFYISILNMYSLIWDCGPMLNSLLWDLPNLQSSMSPDLRQALQSWKNLENLNKIVSSVRSDICHNNSTEYYFNKKAHEQHESFLKPISQDNTISSYSKIDWECTCNTFLILCNNFYTDFINSINIIKNSSESIRSEFITLWLKYIESWYKRNTDISINILANLYPISYNQKGKIQKNITKTTLYKWIACSSQNIQNKSCKDICLNEIKNILNDKLSRYIQSEECPSPALPIPVLTNIFKQKFLYY